MIYHINVSKGGHFFFEINRLSDHATANVKTFVRKLRTDYPVSEGYEVTVREYHQTSRQTDI